MSDPGEILASLTRASAADWFTVASALVSLEETSPASPDGKSWQGVLAARLAEVENPLSVGYLRQLRRVRRLLDAEMPPLLGGRRPEAQDVAGASFLALEAVDRLMAIDPEDGRLALRDALAGASQAQVVRRLRDAQARHPERLSARHAGWKARQEAKAASPDHEVVAEALGRDPGRWWGAANARPRSFRPADRISLLGRTPLGVLFGVDDPWAPAEVGLGGLRPVGKGERLLDVVESVLVQASFFDVYWLWGTDEATRLASIHDQVIAFGARNVGLLRWQESTARMIAPVAEPGSGSRRGMLASAVADARAFERSTRRRRS